MSALAAASLVIGELPQLAVLTDDAARTGAYVAMARSRPMR